MYVNPPGTTTELWRRSTLQLRGQARSYPCLDSLQAQVPCFLYVGFCMLIINVNWRIFTECGLVATTNRFAVHLTSVIKANLLGQGKRRATPII
jgi:hypothetical protein